MQNEHWRSTTASIIHRLQTTYSPRPFITRVKFDQWMRALDKNKVMPEVEEGETIFEYYVNLGTFEWEK